MSAPARRRRARAGAPWALAALWAACSGAPAPPADDPEAAAVALLSTRLFDPPEALRPLFVEGVDPENLPLRLVVDQPADYAFIDVYRFRMVDGRAVVTALVTLEGDPHTLDLWLEHRRGAWRVAGWTHVPRPTDPARPAPPAGADLPVALASVTFRAADAPAPSLALDAPAAGEVEAAVAVRIQRPAVTGACDAETVRRHFGGLRPSLRRCWAAAHVEGGRGGRLTLAIDLDATGRATDARVEETTLLLPGLGACVEAAVRAHGGWTEPADGACAARLAVTFTPER